MDFSTFFDEAWRAYQSNHRFFSQVRAGLERIVSRIDGVPSLGVHFDKAVFLMDTMLGKNVFTLVEALYIQMRSGETPELKNLDPAFTKDLLDFARYLGPLLRNTFEERRAIEKKALIALQSFKEATLQKPPKTALNLIEWMTKWSAYLQREESFKQMPDKPSYKQREIVLVDFGFNVCDELGGRHYAVVLERDNPRAGVVFVAPLSSYPIDKEGRKRKPVHPANVDLEMNALDSSNHSVGSMVVVNQSRFISKLRVEHRYNPRKYVSIEKFEEIIAKLQKRITP